MALKVLIESADPLSHSDETTVLCICLRAMSRRFPIATVLLRAMQLHAMSLKVKLPPACEKLFEEFDSNEWKERAFGRLVSIWPAPTQSAVSSSGGSMGKVRGKGRERIHLGRWIESMEKLNIDGRSSG